MILKLTAQGCRISGSSKKRINKHLEKIILALPHLQKDLVVFRLIIKKNIDRYYPKRVHPHRHKSYMDVKPALAHFEESITFRIARKRFYVHFKGQTIDECINRSFDLIFRELEKYKDLHFPAESEYPDRTSIRKTAFPS